MKTVLCARQNLQKVWFPRGSWFFRIPGFRGAPEKGQTSPTFVSDSSMDFYDACRGQDSLLPLEAL